MYKRVGTFTKLFLAIAAATAATAGSSASAEVAPGARRSVAAPVAQAQSSDVDSSLQKNTKKDGKVDRATATQLNSVTVTATRRSETLQKVPMAISALTSDDLQRQHLQDFADYAAAVPGLSAVGSPGQTELSIRGISSGSGQAVASVGTYLDDTPYGSSSAYAAGAALTPDIDPDDLQRVEVLRGPQGTLYGAGALGGVVRFITTPPDTRSFDGRLQVGGSSVSGGGNGFDVHGMVNLPIVADKLALRANVYHTTNPGYIDDAGLGKKDINQTDVTGSRLSLLWTPSEKTSLRLNMLTQNLNTGGNQDVALDPDTLKPVYGDLQQRQAALGRDALIAHYRVYNATLKSDFGWANLTSSTSYSTLDATINVDATALLPLSLFGYTLPDGGPYGTLEFEPVHQSKVTQEFRLASPDAQTVTWLGGVFFTHEIGNVIQSIPSSNYYTGEIVASPLGNPIEGTRQPSSYLAYAAYGSATWHISDRFDVEAGLRYSHDSQQYKQYLFGSPALGLDPDPNTLKVDNHSSDNSLTYSFTPQFHIDENNLLYARIASGFLPGGPNVVVVGTPNVPPTFDPTELTNYEVGLKSTMMDARLLLDVSAYHIDWKKIPLLTYASGFTFLESGGQAKSNGLEASVTFLPVHGLRLIANAAYNKAVLTKDAPFPSNGKNGDPLPYAPKFNAGLSADYDFALGGQWLGYVGVSYQRVGSRSTNYAFSYPVPGVLPALPASPRIPGYNTVGLRAGVNAGPWSIDIYAKNLTNERGIVSASSWQNYVPVAAQTNPVTGRLEDSATIITPRLIGLSVTRTF
ncbi:MAG: TonB-dependent receptor [Rhodanobacter sp.]